MSDDIRKWEKLTAYLLKTYPFFDLQKLDEQWQREVVGLDRLQTEIWGGGYTTFLVNYGDGPLPYARQALRNVGALKILARLDACHQIVERYADKTKTGRAKYERLDTRTYIDGDGKTTTVKGRMPESEVDKVLEKADPLVDMIAELIPKLLEHYQPLAERAGIKL